MAAVAAYKRKIEVAPNNSGSAGSYAQIETVNSWDLDEPVDKVETTPHGGSGDKTFMQTLMSKELTFEVFFDSSSTPQGTLRTARSSRDYVFVKVYLTDSTGLVGKAWVGTAKLGAPVGDGFKQSFSLTAEGAWSTF